MSSHSSILCKILPFHSDRRVGRAGAFLLASASMFIVSSAVAQKGPAFQVSVRSGQTPITGAVVALLANGSHGYGSKPALLEVAYTDQNGNVKLPAQYTCPAAPGDQVYLVAAEGNSGSGTNKNLSLIAGLGSCSALTSATSVVVNEVTTVASIYALAPFIRSVVNVGSDPSNYHGLVNAFETINNLVNLSTGQALTITPAYASSSVPSLNTSTVPQSRINTLANALESCTKTNGLAGSSTACATLFAATTHTRQAEPQTILQAIENIAGAPGTNVPSIFALASQAGPFQPVLTSAPTDLQLAITYTGAGLGLPPQGSVGDIQNTALALDASGNVLVTAFGEQGGDLVPNSSMLAEFNSLGAPITPATTQPTPTTVSYGGLLTSTLGVPSPIALSVDPWGNAWIAGTSSFINAISPALTAEYGQGIPTGPLGIIEYFAIDGSGDVFTAGNAGNGSLAEYSDSGVLLSPAGGNTGGGTYGNNYYGTLFQPTFDSSGSTIWASDAQFGDLYRINASTGQLTFDYFPMGGQVTPLAAGHYGTIYGCPQGPSSLDVFTASSNSPVASYPIKTGRGCGNHIVLDGFDRVFVIGSVIDEFNVTGTLLSPITGYTGTSAQEASTLNGAISGAVDGSGNLWVLNSSTGSFETNPSNVLVEFVGAAAPVVTPPALAIKKKEVGGRP